MKFPTIKEMAEEVAEKALDEYEYNGKTLREWIEIISASELGTNLAEVGTDCISREQAIEICDHAIDLLKGQFGAGALVAIKESIEELPPAQPERTCVNCGRTANNGGWYADGRTRCPIEEHYALPKDGYCHLWEKRNVTDDDYPEGRADE